MQNHENYGFHKKVVMFQVKLPGVFNKYLISSWKTWCYQFPPSTHEATKKQMPPTSSHPCCCKWCASPSSPAGKLRVWFQTWVHLLRLEVGWVMSYFRFKKQRKLNQTGASLPFFDLHCARFARYYNLLQVFLANNFPTVLSFLMGTSIHRSLTGKSFRKLIAIPVNAVLNLSIQLETIPLS